MTKTNKELLDQVALAIEKVLPQGIVTHHAPTDENKIGQSGFHTLIDDILDAVESEDGAGLHAERWRRLHKLLGAFQRGLKE